VVLALALLFFRTPLYFIAPQIWAEDGTFLVAQAYASGAHSLLAPVAGYLLLAARIIALAGNLLPLAAAPWLYFYFATAALLFVVWLVTSPRLDMPYKPICALALVGVPAGIEIFGGLANSQWTLALAGFAMAFMRPSDSKIVLASEGFLLLLVSLNGPCVLFLLPVYAWRLYCARGVSVERSRLLLLASIVFFGSIVQAILIPFSIGVFYLISPEPYSWTLWVNMPLNRWTEMLDPLNDWLFQRILGVLATAIITPLLVALALRQPYRAQKVCMAIFAGAILYGGMYKYRNNLNVAVHDFHRFAYAGSVFAIWFLCCFAAAYPKARLVIFFVIFAAALNSARLTFSSYRPSIDLTWSDQVKEIRPGAPSKIAIAPQGWFVYITPR
jgi:hypothetical protein